MELRVPLVMRHVQSAERKLSGAETLYVRADGESTRFGRDIVILMGAGDATCKENIIFVRDWCHSLVRGL